MVISISDKSLLIQLCIAFYQKIPNLEYGQGVQCYYSGGSRWVSVVSTETPFQILKKPFSLQFIFIFMDSGYKLSKYPDNIVPSYP